MRISVAWLRALLPSLESSPHAGLDARAIAKRLTGGGLEVEGIERFGAGLEPVVVARVQSIRPHPTKSGLQLVTVDRGGASQEVVCGAKNVPGPGGLVVLAPIGTHLPAVNMTIAPRAIGGVTSEGMLCSEGELGLSFQGKSDHDAGILVLPEGTAEPGTPLHQAIPTVIDDVFEIGVTPNRPDALGHVGVARELAALLGLPFETPRAAAFDRTADVTTESLVKITIEGDAKTRCLQYGARAVLDVGIGPSPLWVRYRLHALGVRSISSAVDVTNLVMFEFGHPLHAFDLDLLEGKAIHVRLAREGEQVVTLDGVTRTLVHDDLVICDGAPNGGKPVAIAGVMGAGNSEISASTKRVLLECAYFDPRTVRRSSRRHGLHTESSHRFERGVDPSGVLTVLDQAAALTAHLGSGAVAKSASHVVAKAPERVAIRLRHSRLLSLLGAAVERDQALSLLQRLGCTIEREDEDVARVLAPTHRPDLGREVDLIEEVARVRGYDTIPSVMPPLRPQAPRNTGVIERRVRAIACELGLSEAVNYGFGSPRELEMLGAPKPVVTLQNPLGEERGAMRTSLLPGLFAALRRSRNRGERRVRLFEVGARFLAGGAEESRGLCDEVPSFAALLAGPRDVWIGQGEEVDVWDAKGVASALVERVTHRTPAVTPVSGDARPKHLHPRGAGLLSVDGVVVGSFGPLHPDMVDRFELDGAAVVVEIDLRALEQIGAITPKYRPLPQLPASTRDVALEVDETVTAGDLEAHLRKGAGAMCESVAVFDVYRGKGIAAGKKSIAFRLTYRDPKGERTLTDAEVDAQHQRAIAETRALGAVQRA